MKPRFRNLSLVFTAVTPLTFGGLTQAGTVTYDADTVTTAAQDGAGAGWNTTNTNFWDGATNVLWPNTTADEAIFGAASGAAGTVTTGAVTANKLTFNAPGSGNYTLSGGTITLGGTTPTIAANADATIGSALAGTAGLTKTGTGTLTLTGSSNYTGASIFGAGAMTFSGTGASTGGGTLNMGTTAGSRAVLNMNSSGTVTHNTTVNVGGATTGAGAINQTSGTMNWMNNTGYLQLGNGGYGSYVVSAGTVNFTSASGARIGDNTGGLGSFVQTGGTVNANRFFVVGGNGGTAPVGVATFTGGTINGSGSYYFILGNGGTARGTMNVGTAAGGLATVVSKNSSGINFANAGSATGILNVNSGTIQFNSGVINKTSSTGTGILNLNGGTLKANAANLTLVNNTVNSANVYNGGLKVDTLTNDAIISANLLTTTGNGIYPAGGVIAMPAAAGAGYIGAPLVTVTTSGSGTGANAIANVTNGQVTGVTLTCPGQNYAEGDTVTFTFAGGGSTSAAVPFVYTLTAADLVANGAGGLTKLGTGKLTLTGANTFTGPVSVTGKLAATNLNLSNTTLTVNDFTPNASSAPLEATAGFTTGGTVPVVINGTFSAGDWPVIYYPYGGSIGGDGISALQLQTGLLPRGVVATLVDNTDNSSVDLSITEFNPLTWKGNVNGIWDINTTTNWTIGANPEKYLEGDIALFGDSVGAGSTSVILNSTVSPAGVTFDNNTKDYTLSGTGSISGIVGLTKSNNGTVTILNANTYSGTTTVTGGTLRLGDGVTNGSIAGPLANEATVVFNPAGSATYAGTISGSNTGVFTKTGSGTQVLTGAITSSGAFQISGGTLRLDRATAVAPSWDKFSGAGTLAINSAVSGDWGNLALPAGFTGTLRVEEGRVGANTGSTLLGGTSKIEILTGAQFLAFTSALPYTTPIEIAGTGWGETGYPGGLRLAGSATATWAGSVTLTTDSGIMAQRGANLTVTGPITGAYQCEFYAGDPLGDSGTLTITPAAPVQNSYASTRINGRPNGSIVAGNAYAFSSGPLELVDAILKLNGNSLSFASLTGTGGKIGNYHASAPATLRTGNGTDTSFAGAILDGGAAPLAIEKTGTGKLTLTGTLGYSGDTTVSAGTLSISSATLNDNATVNIAANAVLELNTSGATDTVGAIVIAGVTLDPGTYDSNHETYGNFFRGDGKLVVVGGFDAWAMTEITDPNKRGREDDADGDGFTNLQEFLFGKDPEVSDGSLTTTERAGNILTIRWNQRTSAATYSLVESATLANPWNPSAAPVTNDGAVSGDYQPKKADVTIAPGRNFFRVEGTEQ